MLMFYAEMLGGVLAPALLGGDARRLDAATEGGAGAGSRLF